MQNIYIDSHKGPLHIKKVTFIFFLAPSCDYFRIQILPFKVNLKVLIAPKIKVIYFLFSFEIFDRDGRQSVLKRGERKKKMPPVLQYDVDFISDFNARSHYIKISQ